MSNWYKIKDLDRKTQAIIMNKERNASNKIQGSSKTKYGVDLFLKFGNSDTNPFNAVDTIKIYKDFSIQNRQVWISTDSLSNGMSQKRIDEFNEAIMNDKIVTLYLIAGKTSGGNNEITHRARILEIQGDKNRMKTPDKLLTPHQWVNGPKKIWIKVGVIRNCISKTTKDFIVISSGKVLCDSLKNSQYNYGYIEEI